MSRALLRTPLCDLLGCELPVVQTAMGWVAGPGLVAATCNAGGFGFLAGATIPAARIEADILRVKELTGGKPFGLNFHMFQPNAQQLLDLAVQHGVRAVSYGRGPDKKVIARLRGKLSKEPGARLFMTPVQDLRIGARSSD